MATTTGCTAEAGREALADGRWADARDCFEALVADGDDPAHLEGLGTAHRWLLDEAAAVDAHGGPTASTAAAQTPGDLADIWRDLKEGLAALEAGTATEADVILGVAMGIPEPLALPVWMLKQDCALGGVAFASASPRGTGVSRRDMRRAGLLCPRGPRGGRKPCTAFSSRSLPSPAGAELPEIRPCRARRRSVQVGSAASRWGAMVLYPVFCFGLTEGRKEDRLPAGRREAVTGPALTGA